MSDNSPRSSVIAMLETLGSDDDAEVLAAARALHATVGELGVRWDDLLVPYDGGATEPVGYDAKPEYEDEEADRVRAAGETDDGRAGKAADDVRRIEQIKAMPGISASLREELDGYLEDIRENEFTAADRRYLKALQDRLAKPPR